MRTVLDCARAWDPLWALALADAAVMKWHVLPQDLVAAAQDMPNGPGSRQARWVAEHARSKVESPLESLARGVLVRAGFPEPKPQVWVSTRERWFRVDLLDETSQVVVEADGKLKYTSPGHLWREKLREDALREVGFEVVRFTIRDHHRPSPWLATYRQALTRGQLRLSRSPGPG